jgi:2,4-dienoyl-CoA reductase (NADPH2)
VHGAETPEFLLYLATHGSKKVTIVELLDDLGKNFGRSTRWGMLQDLNRYGVESRTQSRALEITSSGVRIERDGRIEELPAETIVLAAGTKPYNPLAEIVASLGIPFVVVGDARSAAMVIDAIHQGYAAGAEIFAAPGSDFVRIDLALTRNRTMIGSRSDRISEGE